MKFSERIGKTPVKVELEREGLSADLRNTLWTLTLELVLKYLDDYELTTYYRNLWISFYKKPIDNLPMQNSSEVRRSDVKRKVREWFFNAEWYEVFDFIEFTAAYNDAFYEICNGFLKKEMSAYRGIDGQLTEVSSEVEMEAIETAINDNPYQAVKIHLKTALELFSDRKNPDYRNSIKESISAVESLAKMILNDEKTTLGKALKKIEEKHQIPSGLKAAFSSLYGYTSEEGGIRHSLLENSVTVGLEEARFMLVACSAFVNYLIDKK